MSISRSCSADTHGHRLHARGPRRDDHHQPSGADERDGHRALRRAVGRVGARARRSRDPRGDRHRRGREVVLRGRRSEVVRRRAAAAVGSPAHAEEPDPQPRPRGVEAGRRGGQRLLPGRRHDAAARHRPAHRRGARDVLASRKSSAACFRPTAARSASRSSCRTRSRWSCSCSATASTRRRRCAGASSIAWCKPRELMDDRARIRARASRATRRSPCRRPRSSRCAAATWISRTGLRMEQIMLRVLQAVRGRAGRHRRRSRKSARRRSRVADPGAQSRDQDQ